MLTEKEFSLKSFIEESTSKLQNAKGSQGLSESQKVGNKLIPSGLNEPIAEDENEEGVPIKSNRKKVMEKSEESWPLLNNSPTNKSNL